MAYSILPAERGTSTARWHAIIATPARTCTSKLPDGAVMQGMARLKTAHESRRRLPRRALAQAGRKAAVVQQKCGVPQDTAVVRDGDGKCCTQCEGTRTSDYQTLRKQRLQQPAGELRAVSQSRKQEESR